MAGTAPHLWVLHDPGRRPPSVETNEANNPVLYHWRRLVPNSVGPGLHHGGLSLELGYSLDDTDSAQGALVIAASQ